MVLRPEVAPKVLFDVGSMTGEEAQSLYSSEIVAAWEVGLKHLKAVHHQAGT